MQPMPLLAAVLSILWASASWAQDEGDWEIPEDLKGGLSDKSCPAGTEPDGKGFCVKIDPKARPKPAPIVVPLPEDHPSWTPGGEVRPAPTPAPKPAPIVVPLPQETPAPKAAPIVVPLPEKKPTDPPAEPGTSAGEFEMMPGQSTRTLDGTAPVKETTGPAPEEGAAAAPAAAGKADGEKTPPAGDGAQAGAEEAGKDQEDKGDEGEKGEEKDDEGKGKKVFVKGELSSFIGSPKLVTQNNRIGVRLGWQALDKIHYLTINPELDLRFGDLTFGLGIPLALQMFDGNLQEGDDWKAGFDNAGKFRKKDWDEWQEYARFIRYLTWGKKEDNIYFSLSQYGSNSLGHGALVRRYSVNIDPDSTRVAMQFDMYNDYAGFELMSNSVVSWDLFGALAFFKPLSFFMDHPIARSLSIGFTYAADRHAPVTVATVPAEGVQPANPYYALGDARPRVDSHAFLHTMGVDLEIKILKTDSLDIKPYVDYSWAMPGTPDVPDGVTQPKPEGGGGFTLGLLGRFNFFTEPVHALRLVAEFRSFSGNYLPGYFDTFYEVQKYILGQRHQQYARDLGTLPPTKFQEVFINRKDEGRHLGFYFEFNYSIVDVLALTLALEGSNASYGNHFLAHLEVPVLSWLQFFVSYHQRSVESLSDLFSMDASDKIVFTAIRLRVFPFLFINFRYHHTWQFVEGQADLDGDNLLDSYRYFEPNHGFMGDIEFGWEF